MSVGPPPSPAYGPPKQKPHQSYGIPPVIRPPVAPINTYGPPGQSIHRPQNQYGPPRGPQFNPDIKCDGWRPIPGPSVGTANSNGQVQAILPDNSYLPPSNSLSDSQSHNIDSDLQLPIAEAVNFHTGQSNINVVQSESIEVSKWQMFYFIISCIFL